MGVSRGPRLHRSLIRSGRRYWASGKPDALFVTRAFMRAVWVAGVRWLFSDAAADAFYCAVRWALLVFLAGALLLLGFLIPWRLAHAQTSGFAVSDVVCGPAGIAGVVYISVGGTAANCGSDSQGNQLVLQVSTLSPDQPVDGGVVFSGCS